MLVGQDQKVPRCLSCPKFRNPRTNGQGKTPAQEPSGTRFSSARANRLRERNPGYRPDERIAPFRLLDEPSTSFTQKLSSRFYHVMSITSPITLKMLGLYQIRF